MHSSQHCVVIITSSGCIMVVNKDALLRTDPMRQSTTVSHAVKQYGLPGCVILLARCAYRKHLKSSVSILMINSQA